MRTVWNSCMFFSFRLSYETLVRFYMCMKMSIGLMYWIETFIINERNATICSVRKYERTIPNSKNFLKSAHFFIYLFEWVAEFLCIEVERNKFRLKMYTDSAAYRSFVFLYNFFLSIMIIADRCVQMRFIPSKSA